MENDIRAGNTAVAWVGRVNSTLYCRRPLLGPALLLILLGLTAVGCSKGPSETDTAGTSRTSRSTASTLNTQEQGVKFAECMRGNGLSDFPDPEPDGDFAYFVSVTPEVWKRTLATCKELQPPGTLSSKRTPEEQSETLKFAQCIRDHGVKDFPDPVNGEPAINTYKIPSSNSEDGMRILDAAINACKDATRGAIGNKP
jgi:hypothetical protein